MTAVMTGKATEKRKERLHSAVWKLLYALLGFLLSRVTLPAGFAPLGTAYIAAMPKGGVSAGLIGAAAGTLIPGGVQNRLRYIAAALAAAGIKWAFAELRRINRHPAFPSCAAFAGLVLTGITVRASVGKVMAYDIIVYCAEGLIAAGAALFLSGALIFIKRLSEVGGAKKAVPSRREQGCLAMTAAAASIPLCSLTIGGFSPAAVFLMLAVIAAAREQGAKGGAAAGVTAGMVLSFALGNYYFAGVCAAAGFVSGVFNMTGRVSAFICPSVFAASVFLGELAGGDMNVYLIIEACVAASVFPFIRGRAYEFLFSWMRTGEEKSRETRSDAPERLSAAADAIGSISETMGELTKRLGEMNEPDPESVCRQTAGEICGSCSVRTYCWEEKAERTKSAFDEACAVLEKDGEVKPETVPKPLTESCARSSEVLERLNVLYAAFTERRNARRRTAQVRSVLSDQLGGMSGMLYELADELGTPETLDGVTGEKVREALTQSGYTAESVTCAKGADGIKITAQVRGKERTAIPRDMLGEVIEKRLGVPLSRAEIIPSSGGRFTLKMSSRPPLELKCGAAQHRCRDEKLCGDSYDIFTSGSASYMLLSDGMGSGGRAAVDSAMTCSLLSRLLRAGFSCLSAIRIVNAALLVKSDDESLSTVDCFRFDLFSGDGEFIKAGSARSFVRSGNRVKQIEPRSLPLGILRGADASESGVKLRPGDIVVMVSDGADDGDCGWLTDELASFEGEPQGLARDILSLACARWSGGYDDDITVLAAAVTESGKQRD